MNSETIILITVCLLVVTTFILFKSQFFILLNRLASTEFRIAGNLWTKPETVASKDTKPWAWHKVWLNSLLHPNDKTWNRLLFEENISFKKAYGWITITSLLFPLVYSIVVWVKFSSLITVNDILNSAKNILLIGIFEPIGFIVVTGIIHIFAKLFGKGSFQSFFIVFATSYVPISLLYTFAALARWSFTSKFWLYAGVVLNFYFMIFTTTEIIRVNYHVNRPIGFLINIAATALSLFLAYLIYYVTGFGI